MILIGTTNKVARIKCLIDFYGDNGPSNKLVKPVCGTAGCEKTKCCGVNKRSLKFLINFDFKIEKGLKFL